MMMKTVLPASLLVLFAAVATAQTPSPPAVAMTYVYCYGPVPDAISRPDKVYFSGVSAIPMPLSSTVYPGFIAFVKQKYGEDVIPRCDFGSQESNSRAMLKYWITQLKGSAVETGWVWTEPPTDPAKTPVQPARGEGH